MLFNSTVFLFWFLPIAVVGYYLLAHRVGPRYAKVWLCGASFVFYGWWNPAFLFLLCGSITFNYWLSGYLNDDESAAGRQRWILGLGVAANLLLLFYYKYLFPLLGFLQHLGWTQTDFGSVILPIGISFFTFTQIGYLVDCRQGLVKERGLINYVLFVTFFPHLIAGPILHHREIMPQFSNDATYRFRSDYFASGITLFVFGMIKKVVLADNIAPWAEAGFAHAPGTQMLQAWSVILAYSMQLYFDFSGYSDMAVGLGAMFGVKLPLNFNSPYKSASIIEFWQRWHMTLTRYLTLLLYNPISLHIVRRRQQMGRPTGKAATETLSGFSSMVVFPTVCTMFLAGLWHGAGLQFIVYGVLHGAYLSINHAWRLFYPANTLGKLQGLAKAWGTFWRVAVTFVAVLVAQVFFRADSTADAWELVAGAAGLHGTGLPLIVPLGNLHYLGALQDFVINHHILAVGLRSAYNDGTLALLSSLELTVALMVIAFAAPNVYQVLDKWQPSLAKIQPVHWRALAWRPSFAWALVTAGMLFFAAQHFNHTARFLYFQF